MARSIERDYLQVRPELVPPPPPKGKIFIRDERGYGHRMSIRTAKRLGLLKDEPQEDVLQEELLEEDLLEIYPGSKLKRKRLPLAPRADLVLRRDSNGRLVATPRPQA